MVTYKNCLLCTKIFKTWTCRIKIGAGRFCSSRCRTDSLKGKPSWNKGIKGLQPWMNINGLNHTGEKFTEEHKRKIGLANSIALKGKKQNPETVRKRADKIRGFKMNLEARLKISASKKGKKNNFWRGGVSEINDLIRHSFLYKEWRKSVYKRDNYTCVICGAKSHLNADHIRPFSTCPDLRFDLNNGRTLCVGCHQKTNTYGRGALNYAS